MKIAPSDVYQVYSYIHYFESDIGYIFTPKLYIDDKQKIDEYIFQTHQSNDSSKKLYIYYVDLENITMQEQKW